MGSCNMRLALCVRRDGGASGVDPRCCSRLSGSEGINPPKLEGRALSQQDVASCQYRANDRCELSRFRGLSGLHLRTGMSGTGTSGVITMRLIVGESSTTRILFVLISSGIWIDRLQPAGSAPTARSGEGLSRGSLFYGKVRKFAKVCIHRLHRLIIESA